ncbi:MAG: deoxyribonuclease IV [Streptosporangiales bacterium]|nr:deoxyribonuclease IV [Streptosporangiales bacterium]
MRIGAHIDRTDPLADAKARDADIAQFFLGDPQGWKKPQMPDNVDALRDAASRGEIDVYVHAPYIINVATSNNRIRIPSRKNLSQNLEAAAAVGAKALIVHGGHVLKDDDPALGFENWRKTFERVERPVPIYIENTAGGDNAMTRRLDRLARLWDALEGHDVGFCLDTCHAHAGGEELLDLVDRVKAITGRIDLVHCNDSKDPFDSGRDRHENLGAGQIDPELLAAMVRAAGAPVVCETPGGADGQAADIAWLRARLDG